MYTREAWGWTSGGPELKCRLLGPQLIDILKDSKMWVPAICRSIPFGTEFCENTDVVGGFQQTEILIVGYVLDENAVLPPVERGFTEPGKLGEGGTRQTVTISDGTYPARG